MPAILHRMSSRPWFSSACATRRPRHLITDVLGRERRRITAVGYLACDALAQGGVAVGQQHLRPVQREDARRLGTDPRRTSGHDRDLADQSFAWVHGCLPRPPEKYSTNMQIPSTHLHPLTSCCVVP